METRQLVALLFVAATPMRRAEVSETLRVGPARLSRAYAVLRADLPRGLRLEESGDQLGPTLGRPQRLSQPPPGARRRGIDKLLW